MAFYHCCIWWSRCFKKERKLCISIRLFIFHRAWCHKYRERGWPELLVTHLQWACAILSLAGTRFPWSHTEQDPRYAEKYAGKQTPMQNFVRISKRTQNVARGGKEKSKRDKRWKLYNINLQPGVKKKKHVISGETCAPVSCLRGLREGSVWSRNSRSDCRSIVSCTTETLAFPSACLISSGHTTCLSLSVTLMPWRVNVC